MHLLSALHFIKHGLVFLISLLCFLLLLRVERVINVSGWAPGQRRNDIGNIRVSSSCLLHRFLSFFSLVDIVRQCLQVQSFSMLLVHRCFTQHTLKPVRIHVPCSRRLGICFEIGYFLFIFLSNCLQHIGCHSLLEGIVLLTPCSFVGAF